MEIPDIVKEHALSLAIAIVFALAGVAVKLAKSIFDFYEGYIHGRKLKIIKTLQTSINNESSAQFLNILHQNEIFRLATGIKCSPQKSESLMELFQTGIISSEELKRLERFLSPSCDNIVEIKIYWPEKIAISYSFVSAAIIFSMGLLISTPFIFSDSKHAFVVSAVIIFTTSICARILSKDFRDYLLSRKLKEKILNLNIKNPTLKTDEIVND